MAHTPTIARKYGNYRGSMGLLWVIGGMWILLRADPLELLYSTVPPPYIKRNSSE